MTTDAMTSPYRGLTPYTEADAAYFFGRTHEIAIVAANLEVSRLTIFYGPSGVGKSSVLRAGVVHQLRQRARRNFQARGSAKIIPIYFNRWQADPMTGLAQAVAEGIAVVDGGDKKMTVPADLQLAIGNSQSFTSYLHERSKQTDSDLLLVLDQFEEYFLYHQDEVGPGSFADELVTALTTPDLRVNFLLSLREDALARLDHFKGQIPFLLDNRLSIGHLGRIAGEEAIRKPLERYNHDRGATITIEPELITAILDQVGSGRIALSQQGTGVRDNTMPHGEREQIEAPYLQLVMTRLWEEEQANHSTNLRLTTLDDNLGGAETIVRNYLNNTLAALDQANQALAVGFFDRLVTPSGTKIALSLDEVIQYTGAQRATVEQLLIQLQDRRLLRGIQSPKGSTQYEIFHDVLAPAILEYRHRYLERQAQEQARQAEIHRQIETRRIRRERRKKLLGRAGIGLAFLLLIMLVGLTLWAFDQDLHIVGEWTDLQGPPGGTIIPLVADPGMPDSIYVRVSGRDAGLYKTVDGGQTWRPVSLGLSGIPVLTLAMHPVDSDIIYLGTAGAGVFRSTDGGASWEPVNLGLGNLNVLSLLINMQSPETLYAATSGVSGGIFRTLDGGARWTRYGTGMDSENIYALLPDLTDNNTFYALTDFGVFRTNDFGTTYRIADHEFPVPVIQQLLMTGGTSRTRYVVARGGRLWRKGDDDPEWLLLRLENIKDTVLFVIPDSLDGDALYASVKSAVGGYSFLRSPDRGDTWYHVDSGLTKSPILGMTITPRSPNSIYLGTASGLFKSLDQGRSWDIIAVGSTKTSVRAIAVAPDDPHVIVAGVYGGIFRSADAGLTWTPTNQGLLSAEVRSIAINPLKPKEIFVGVYNPGLAESVFRSTDAGQSWVASSEGLSNDDCRSLLISATSPWTIYAGTFGDGVYRSLDGLRWVTANNGLSRLDVVALAGDASTPQVMFAATGGGIFRTHDGGDSWELASDGLDDLDVQALATAFGRPDLVYAGTRKNGVYVSRNQGRRWEKASTGITRLNVVALASDPEHPETAYAGTDTGGVFRTTDGGRTWSSVTRGMASASITALTVAPQSVLYAGTADAGVLEFTTRYLWETRQGPTLKTK